ncbi:hypothetical protein AUJ13_04490 [Candidatus Micrarchaeota archaeon CG1_02_49_24]|nr:MAG: hypothetical protein AUJ13_04490 [Candidatus Micrarchaeota archaeon CG1_02_49_24]
MNAKRQLHENSRTTVLEIFAIKRKLDFRMSLHTLHIVQGLSHQRERLFGKSDTGDAWFDWAGEVRADKLFEFDDGVVRALRGLSIRPLFGKLEEFERRCGGVPQYPEWALTFEAGMPVWWHLQCADAGRKDNVFDFNEFGRPVIEGADVVNAGKARCSKIAIILGESAVACLNQFNQENERYILIVPADMVSTKRDRNIFPYNVYNNLSVLLEAMTASHWREPIQHFDEKLRQAGKLFASIEPHHLRSLKERYPARVREITPDFIVIDGEFEVVASERQDRLVVFEVT